MCPDWDEDGEYYDPTNSSNNDMNDPYLDIDDTDGYGPEHITVYSLPAGIYSVAVDYYDDYGLGPSDATVTVTLYGGTSDEIVETFGPYNLSHRGYLEEVITISMTKGTFSSSVSPLLWAAGAIMPEKGPLTSKDTSDTSTTLSLFNASVTAAEYFIDVVDEDGTGQPMSAVDGAFDSDIEEVMADIDVSGLTSGNHTLFVHGKGKDGWGLTESVEFSLK